jgi:hypothetical protein
VSSLSPCPGCGRCSDGNNDYVARSPRESEKVYYHKACSCGWRGPEATTLDAARAAWNRRTPALRWRREPPDVPGWYWYCDAQLSVRIAHWDAREIAELLSGIRFPHRLEPRWAGPIAEPEEMRA